MQRTFTARVALETVVINPLTVLIISPCLPQSSCHLSSATALLTQTTTGREGKRTETASKEKTSEAKRKRRRLPECLKTQSGKYLAPKLISLFDHRQREGEEGKTERFDLK